MKNQVRQHFPILLVINHQDEAEVYLDRLSRFGFHQVIVALDGEESLSHVKKKSFGVAIVEVGLQGRLSGFEVGDIIGKDFKTPVIYIGQGLNEDDYQKAFDTHPWAFFSTPINWLDLKICLENIFRQTHLVGDHELHLLYEEAPLPYQSLNSDGTIRKVNRAWCQLLGVKSNEVLGSYFGDYLVSADQPVFKENFGKFKTLTGVSDVRYRMKQASGETILVSIDGKVIRDEQGKYKYSHCILRNISSKQKILEALQSSEKMFKTLFEVSADAMFLADASSGKILEANRAASILLEKPIDQIIGSNQKSLHPEDQLREVAEAFSERTENDKEFPPMVELDVLTGEGKRKPVEITGKAFHFNGRELVLGAFRDLSERKERERQIYFQAHLLDAVSQSVIATDMTGIIVYWGQAAEKLYGWSKEEVMGKNILEVTPIPDMEKAAADIMKELQKGLSWMGYFRIQRKDGSSFMARIEDSPVCDASGKLMGIIGISEDVTKELAQQELLRHSEEKFRKSFENSAICMGLVSREGNFVQVNNAACELLGYSREELLSLQYLKITHPDDVDLSRDQYICMQSGECESYNLEKRYLHKDGSVIWAKLNVSAINDAKGAFQYGLAQLQDITFEKKALDKLVQKRRLLDHAEELAVLGSFDWNFVTREISWSDGLYRIYNRNKAEGPPEQVGYKKWLEETIHPEDRELMTNAINEAIEHTGQYDVQYRLLRYGDRQERWIHAKGMVFNDPNGKPNRLVGIAQDITVRVQTNQALFESEQKYRLLFENSAFGVGYYDHSGRLIEFNDVAAELMDGKPEDFTGRTFEELFGEAGSIYRSRFNQVIASREPADFEDEITLAAGIRSYFSTYNPIISHEGKILGLQIYSQDFTEAKQAKEELIKAKERAEESESKYRDLVEKSGVAVLTDNREGEISYFNRDFARLFGYTVREMGSRDKADLFPGKEVARINHFHKRRMEGHRVPNRYELKGIKKDGTEIQIEVRTSVLKDTSGKILGTRNYIWDMTERKQIEEALLNSETRFRELFSRMKSGVIILKWEKNLKDWTITDMNRSAQGILKTTLGRVLHQSFWGSISQFDDQDIRTKFREISQQGNYTIFPLTRYRGNAIEYHYENNLFQLPGGELVLIFEDQTKRIIAELALTKSYEEIKKLSRHILEVREDERKQMARNLHDELGQVLTAIKMDVTWIQRNLSPEQKSLLQRSDAALETIDNTIGDIQLMTTELRPPMLDNLGLFVALKSLIAKYGERSRIKTRIDLPKLETVLSPEMKISIYRIVQESITNVMRHSAASEMILIIKEKNDNLSIEIRDNGIGISEEKKESSDSLGLIGIKERVLQWNGRFSITGEEGKGTIIRISLPVPA